MAPTDDDVPSSRRRTPRRSSIALVLVAILVATGLLVIDVYSLLPTPEPTPVPSIAGIDAVSSANVDLESYRGRLVIIDFWAISCIPCRVLEHELQQLMADPDWSDRVAILSINVDPTENASMIAAFARQEGITWVMIDDADGAIQRVYGAPVLPTIFVIDGAGFLTYRQSGVPTLGQLKDALNDADSGKARRVPLVVLPLLVLALLTGVASFFSPCSFPLLPTYLVYSLQRSANAPGRGAAWRALRGGAAAAGGLLSVYTLVGVVLVGAGSLIRPALGSFNVVMGVLLVTLGALMLTNIGYARLTEPIGRLLRSLGTAQGERTSMRGMFAYGVGYGLAAAGCTAPLFLAVVAASLTVPLLEGISAIVLYAGAAAALMMGAALAVATAGARALKQLSVHTATIKTLSAALLVMAGISLLTLFVAERQFGAISLVAQERPFLQLIPDWIILVVALHKAARDRRALRPVQGEIPKPPAEGPQ